MVKFTNQSELFEHIFNTRPWFSEISGRALFTKGHWQYHWQFAHIYAKSVAPRFKLREFNIVLLLPEEHTFFDNFSESKKQTPMYTDYQNAWDALFEVKELLKQHYHSKKLC